MATVVGQSTDPIQPGVLGTPMNVNVPGTLAIGVKGDGGAGVPSPVNNPLLNPVLERRGVGVYDTSADPNGIGTAGENTGGGTGIYGRSDGGNAGQFDGTVQINGDLKHDGNHECSGTVSVKKDIVLSAADCAEEFDVREETSSEPGSVVTSSMTNF